MGSNSTLIFLLLWLNPWQCWNAPEITNSKANTLLRSDADFLLYQNMTGCESATYISGLESIRFRK